MKTAKKPINYDTIAFWGICACLCAAMNGVNPWLCAAAGFAFGCLASNPDRPDG